MPTTRTRKEKKSHGIALWASLTALFTNLATINIIVLLGANGEKVWAQAVAALVTAVCVAASIYAKQRWDDVKQ